VVLPHQQIPVQSHHDIGDVGAHFKNLTEIGNHDYFVVLHKPGTENRGTKVIAQSPSAASHGIKQINNAIEAVEFSVGTHVRIKVLFQLLLLVYFYCLNDLPIQE
jgi:hypothetical protein